MNPIPFSEVVAWCRKNKSNAYATNAQRTQAFIYEWEDNADKIFVCLQDDGQQDAEPGVEDYLTEEEVQQEFPYIVQLPFHPYRDADVAGYNVFEALEVLEEAAAGNG